MGMKIALNLGCTEENKECDSIHMMKCDNDLIHIYTCFMQNCNRRFTHWKIKSLHCMINYLFALIFLATFSLRVGGRNIIQ